MSDLPQEDGAEIAFVPNPAHQNSPASALHLANQASPTSCSRRRFLGKSVAATLGVAAAGILVSRAQAQTPPPAPGGATRTQTGTTPDGTAQLKFEGPVDEAYWRKVRAQFNLVGGLTFLNNGTLGPVSRLVRELHEQWDTTLSENPTDSFRSAELDAVRKRVAAFINAAPEEVALTRSTTEGMNIFAHGLDWKPGDEVILSTLEHFGATDAYKGLEKRQGIKIKSIDLPAAPQSVEEIVSAYEKAITPNTRLIVVSHVAYVNGLVLPIKELTELAHRHNLLISVDGAQSLGVLPLDVKDLGLDHYAAPGQKWLLAGTGTGFTYIRKDLQDRVQPLMGNFDPEGVRGGNPSARRYEQNGQYNIPAAVGIGAAVELQVAIGKQNIETRARELATRLRSGAKEISGVQLLTPIDPRLAANITTLSIGELPGQAIVKALQEREGIVVRSIKAAGVNGIRVSTHFYNTPEEVDRLLKTLRVIAANPTQFATAAHEGKI